MGVVGWNLDDADMERSIAGIKGHRHNSECSSGKGFNLNSKTSHMPWNPFPGRI